MGRLLTATPNEEEEEEEDEAARCFCQPLFGGIIIGFIKKKGNLSKSQWDYISQSQPQFNTRTHAYIKYIVVCVCTYIYTYIHTCMVPPETYLFYIFILWLGLQGLHDKHTYFKENLAIVSRVDIIYVYLYICLFMH